MERKKSITATKKNSEVESLRENACELIKVSLKNFKDIVKEDQMGPIKFFPNGIDLIDIKVAVGGIDVSFKVAGPSGTGLSVT